MLAAKLANYSICSEHAPASGSYMCLVCMSLQNGECSSLGLLGPSWTFPGIAPPYAVEVDQVPVSVSPILPAAPLLDPGSMDKGVAGLEWRGDNSWISGVGEAWDKDPCGGD